MTPSPREQLELACIHIALYMGLSRQARIQPNSVPALYLRDISLSDAAAAVLFLHTTHSYIYTIAADLASSRQHSISAGYCIKQSIQHD